MVGAVGISGGSVEEDIQVAESVTGALEQMECWFEYLKEILPSAPMDGDRVYRLESRLREALEEMNYDLPPDTASVLCGAIVLAVVAET